MIESQWTKHKNANGSIDWTTPLPDAPRVVDYGTATIVLRWYNFETRDWVVSLADDERHQIGASTYVPHLVDANAEAEYLKGQQDCSCCGMGFYRTPDGGCTHCAGATQVCCRN